LKPAAALFVGSLLAMQAGAQQYTRSEIGAGIAGHTYSISSRDSLSRYLSEGPYGTYTYNLAPYLAVEGSVAYLPQFNYPQWQDTGQELQAVGGFKAGWRGRRWGIYGKVEPGIASFSCGLAALGRQGQISKCDRRTHFTLQYGGVAEYELSPRWALRGDAAQSLTTEFDQVFRLDPSGFAREIIQGHIAQHLDLRLGIVRRFGVLREEPLGPAAKQSTMEVGILFALQPKVHQLFSALEQDRGGGAWVSWNFSRYFGVDATAYYLPHNDKTINYNDGGATLEGFAGIKAGIRRDHIGYFAKVRPGSIVFTNVLDSLTEIPGGLLNTHSKSPNFALDTGAIVELYPSAHSVLRVEAGNASIFYSQRTIRVDGQPATVNSPEAASVLLLFGAGLRF
jgi:hypothetical protein